MSAPKIPSRISFFHGQMLNDSELGHGICQKIPIVASGRSFLISRGTSAKWKSCIRIIGEETSLISVSSDLANRVFTSLYFVQSSFRKVGLVYALWQSGHNPSLENPL